MAKQHFEFSKSTGTIRLMPQNYMVAVKPDNGANIHWRVDADQAVNLDMLLYVTTRIHQDFNLRYASGETLAKELNDGCPFF